MPSSDAAASSSSLELIGDPAVSRSVRVDGEGAAGSSAVLSKARTAAEHIVSYLRTQREVDELCGRYGVPGEFKARPAGELRMSSTPPPGHVCLCAHALEAGMRVPLHPFFCEVLCHYRLAPTQLAPNGWRNVAGFVVLCHFAGVPPSLPVFRSFFSLFRYKEWYHFRSKDSSAGVLFTGTPTYIKDWKQGYFFLSSPAPWPCPVEWGAPPKSSTTERSLTSDEKRSAAKLLRARGGAAIDLHTYLCDSNLAAAKIAAASPPPTPHSARASTSSPKGMEPSVYDVMKAMRAEKAAAKNATTEPLSGKKRNREEADAKDGALSPSVAIARPATHGGLGGGSVSGAYSRPRGFSGPQSQSGKPREEPDRHDGDAVDWKDARKLLQDLVTPSRARVFAAAENPSDVVASSYVAMLQAANYASFSMGYAMELNQKLRDAAAELEKSKTELAEAGALREDLEKTRAELDEARKAAASELEGARSTAVREYLASTENVRRLAEHALQGYERGMEHMKRVALRLYPHIDAARLVVPPDGPPAP